MLFTFVLLIAITSLTVARQQTFTATGTLQCNNKPAAGQTVQLKFTDPLLKGKVDATVKTAADGSFKISGTKRARASQKAYLWIEHNCDAKQRKSCQVMTYIPIPANYDNKVYPAGKQELSKNAYYNSCDDMDQ
ncbi:hypothetical protein Y032_0042g606 [Ancylostoma ceylanicum]|uniref:Transthyretin-like family protein n=1 Tax=Ancylostoma ceylanicum TaxID=53326 RepID=A0A016UGG8_9BILA|nr:hypothetical protein Y032_0042g606 [Ancylostoma ceylanicum]